LVASGTDRRNLCSARRQTQAQTDGHTQIIDFAFFVSQAVQCFDAELCVQAVVMSGCENCVGLAASDTSEQGAKAFDWFLE
jgi:hypothetical protein